MTSPTRNRPPGRWSFWAVAIVACLANFMTIVDVTVVNVALPSVKRSLDLSIAGQQWVVNSYLLIYGGFLLVGGRSVDLFGRKRVFVGGLVLFTASSIAAGLAQNAATLLTARAFQGLGASTLAPAALALLQTAYVEPRARAKAFTMLSVVASSGLPVGAVLGGVLTDAINWRWVFFINGPIGVLMIVAAALVVTESSAQVARWSDLDLPGGIVVTGAMTLLIYGVVETRSHPWGSAHTVVLLVVAVALLAIFLAIESRAARPLVPLRIFRVRSLVTGNVIALMLGSGLTSIYFFFSLQLQDGQGYTPLEAGLSIVPSGVAMALTTMLTGRLVHDVGPRRLLLVAAIVAAAGTFWLAQLSVGDGYLLHVFLPVVVFSVGLGLCFVPMTLLATQDVAPTEAGLASGIMNASRQISGAVALAILVTVAASHTSGLLDGRAPTPRALLSGYDLAITIDAALFLAMIVPVVLLLPRRRPARIEG